jgi:hypothetical protein
MSRELLKNKMNIFKKLAVTFFILFVVSHVSYGQVSFSHSLGGSAYISSLASSSGIMYSPRINFMTFRRSSTTLSIGTHFGLGFSFKSEAGTSSSSFALDIPVVVELNLGHAASPGGRRSRSRSNFGGFAGIGFGINKVGSASSFGGSYNDAAGIVIDGGLRAMIAGKSYGLRLSYLLNLKEGFENVIGVGMFYTFGQSR